MQKILSDMLVDMSTDAAEKLAAIKAAGMLDKINTTPEGGVRYKVNGNFYEQLDNWDGNTKVSSAEGRSHIKSLFTHKDGTPVAIRYVDKERIQSWLNVNRLQLPLHNLDLDSNLSIFNPGEKVKKISMTDSDGNQPSAENPNIRNKLAVGAVKREKPSLQPPQNRTISTVSCSICGNYFAKSRKIRLQC